MYLALGIFLLVIAGTLCILMLYNMTSDLIELTTGKFLIWVALTGGLVGLGVWLIRIEKSRIEMMNAAKKLLPDAGFNSVASEGFKEKCLSFTKKHRNELYENMDRMYKNVPATAADSACKTIIRTTPGIDMHK